MRKPRTHDFSDILRDVERRMTRDLIRYTNGFMAITGMAESTICRHALRDPSYLAAVRRGERAVTPKQYDLLVLFFDKTLKKAKNAAARA